MMSTFNATSQHAFGVDRMDPIIRSGSRKRPQENYKSISGDSTNDHTNINQQQRGGYCHAYSQRQQQQQQQSKRQRQNADELQYVAATATIQKALADAGRPAANSAGRSSPRPDGVDMDGCRVVTAREFDEEFNFNGGDDRQDAKYDDCDDYDLASMYMIAGLVRSTRRHYDFSSNDDDDDDDDEAPTESGNAAAGPSSPSSHNYNGEEHLPLPPTKTQSKSASGKEEAHGISTNANSNDENSSEVLSSWTPSSGSFNHLNYYSCGKNGSNIDNDNRSDGQSSDMAGEGGGELVVLVLVLVFVVGVVFGLVRKRRRRRRIVAADEDGRKGQSGRFRWALYGHRIGTILGSVVYCITD